MFPTYQRKVQRCSAEISSMLPELAAKHTALILLAALTEQVGGSLFLTQEVRQHSARRVREIIKRVRRIALSA
jgi:hypothetical protein